MKIYKVLERAKPYLWLGSSHWMPDDRQKYICYCIGYLQYQKQISHFDAWQAKKFIDNQLGGCSTLELWLHNQGIVDLKDSFLVQKDRMKMQATRLAWLNHMIEFCKKENI